MDAVQNFSNINSTPRRPTLSTKVMSNVSGCLKQDLICGRSLEPASQSSCISTRATARTKRINVLPSLTSYSMPSSSSYYAPFLSFSITKLNKRSPLRCNRRISNHPTPHLYLPDCTPYRSKMLHSCCSRFTLPCNRVQNRRLVYPVFIVTLNFHDTETHGALFKMLAC